MRTVVDDKTTASSSQNIHLPQQAGQGLDGRWLQQTLLISHCKINQFAEVSHFTVLPSVLWIPFLIFYGNIERKGEHIPISRSFET